jgi:hypothetical protein
MLKVVVAVVGCVAILRVGFWALRLIGRPAPAPPPVGELRKVNVRYRCPMCGMEMKVLLAPDQDPVPPRHCMEEMELTAAPYE